ncbi:hypothetical protein [Flavobacterium sp.]|uniref:hypothetical protein n=1 Tax=Flavobacterium sp. TaxID=239 RepID=UPI0012125BE5|nr:hypothetical protein [Flavobacterium sp.]RZJ73588.1 MAG: hypothetical protein EOO49_01910 [Flavobacterium sp.]
MHNTTSLELKCECTIPFRSDIIAYLEKLFNIGAEDAIPNPAIPQEDAVAEALRNKALFVTVGFSQPVKKIRPAILKKLKSFFHKDIVAIMKSDNIQITYLLI